LNDTAAIHWFRVASPASFYPRAGKLTGLFGWVAILLAVAGLYVGVVIAPTDAQQGESYRIIFIHVPAAWMAMFLYLVMAGWCAASLIWNTRLSAMMAQALAPTGAMFSVVALWTGALWGRPTWGAYWVWDARLTSTLILLFLYLGYMALVAAIEDPVRADRAGALLLLIGVVNIPIIYFSVRWWNTLHQGASVSLTTAPKMAQTMLTGMLIMSFAAWMYTIAAALHRVRSLILDRERHTHWVRQRYAPLQASSASSQAPDPHRQSQP
jgi:heme exporter protein C